VQCIKFASPVKTFLESFQMQERLLIILKMEYTLPEESEWSIISKNWDKIYVGDTKIILCVIPFQKTVEKRKLPITLRQTKVHIKYRI